MELLYHCVESIPTLDLDDDDDQTSRLYMPEQLRVCPRQYDFDHPDRTQRLWALWDRMHLSQGKV